MSPQQLQRRRGDAYPRLITEEGWDVCKMRWTRAPITLLQRNVALSGVYPYSTRDQREAWVDLCCGIGGMTSGLELQGEVTALAVDKDDKAVRAWNCFFWTWGRTKGLGGASYRLGNKPGQGNRVHHRLSTSAFLFTWSCGCRCGSQSVPSHGSTHPHAH